MRWRIGTCGWQYRDWRDVLYPAGLPHREWLAHYAAEFDTVEIDSTFYRLASTPTFSNWGVSVPDDFVFAVKASRYLTHIQRLHAPAEPVARLLEHAEALGPHLGPVLVQLPPTLSCDVGALQTFLRAFPTDVRVAVEFRHDSWFIDDVREVMVARGAALVWTDWRNRRREPSWITTTWGYVRLHEGTAGNRAEYGERALVNWRDALMGTFDDSVYVYFNNDAGGAAVRNARRMQRLAEAAPYQGSD